MIRIFCDGGARGNPGEAAAAFVVEKEGKIIYSEAALLGKTTNNIAEYQAVYLALKWLSKNPGVNRPPSDIEFLLDSELVTKQINRVYRVKNKNLKDIFKRIEILIKQIPDEIFFKNITREKNIKADFLVNQKLDCLL